MQINTVNTTKVVNNTAQKAGKVIETAKDIVQKNKTNLALASAAVSGAYIAHKAAVTPLKRDMEMENKWKNLTNSPEEFRKAMRLAYFKFDDSEIKNIINDEKLFNRAIALKELGLSSKTIKEYINLSDSEFDNYVSLAKSGMLSNGSELLDPVKNKKYLKYQNENLKKAIYFTKLGIPDSELASFLKMAPEDRAEILQYLQKGAGYNMSKDILKSPKKDEINRYISDGLNPVIALRLTDLSNKKKDKFFSLKENGANQVTAFRASNFPEHKEKLFNNLMKLGLKPHVAADIAAVDLVSKSKILNPQITGDIKTIIESELYKKDDAKLEDIFVKKYSKKEDAIKGLKTGETCRIGDSEKVNIKKSDGTLEELNLSAQKYMELFPPVTRFSISQGQIGDCFLISTLDATFKNPKTRVNLLRCFNENEKGDVTVKYPKSDITFTVKNGKKIDDYLPETFKDIHTSAEKNGESSTVSGADGIRMMEYLYGKVSQDRDIKHYNKRIDTTWERIRRATEDYQIDNLHDDLMKYFMVRKLNVLSPEQARIGGRSYNVMDSLGLKNAQMYSGSKNEGENYAAIDGRHGQIEITSSFEKGLEKIKKEGDNLLILAGTKPINDKNPRGIVGPHAYELEVIKKDDGSYLFRITNPHNSTSSVDLTEGEFREYFANIYTSEIGD